jgi:hypothetical protein
MFKDPISFYGLTLWSLCSLWFNFFAPTTLTKDYYQAVNPPSTTSSIPVT